VLKITAFITNKFALKIFKNSTKPVSLVSMNFKYQYFWYRISPYSIRNRYRYICTGCIWLSVNRLHCKKKNKNLINLIKYFNGTAKTDYTVKIIMQINKTRNILKHYNNIKRLTLMVIYTKFSLVFTFLLLKL